MTQIQSFTFNAMAENTYVLYDETKECIIIDPGCYNERERATLSDFIRHKGLRPQRLLNTHAHLDHIFGNEYVREQYDLGLEMHEGELPVLKAAPAVAQMYGFQMPPQRDPTRYIADGETITFGNTTLQAILAPGHSPASLCFYSEKDAFLIGGDVLFYDSIGRTDLPGGDYATLIRSIQTRILTLPDAVKVYSGHGGATTVGRERRENPFLQ
jgi:hydroxyacylglutathione hydrolase